MNDVIAAALIAGGVGLAGNIVTYLASRKGAMEETKRRLQDLQHADLAVARDDYSRLGWLLGRLHKYGDMGMAPSQADWMDWLDEYSWARGNVLISGTEQVAGYVERLTGLLDSFGGALRSRQIERIGDQGEWSHVWLTIYADHREGLEDAQADVMTSMRASRASVSP